MPSPLSTPAAGAAQRNVTVSEPFVRRRPLPLVPRAGSRVSLAEARAIRQDEAGYNPSGGWGELATSDLIERLGVEDAGVAAGARAELLRRGFREADFELARQLVRADSAARLEIARKLPGMEGIDAAPWLLWLSRDENADVRLTALGLLATTGTPELLEQAERIARDDPDPRIQQQADKLAQRRRELR